MKGGQYLTTYKKPNNMQFWHEQFGHLGVKNLKLLSNKNLVEGMNIDKEAKLTFCDRCVRRKQH